MARGNEGRFKSNPRKYIQYYFMIKYIQLLAFSLFTTVVLSKNLQTVYDYIIIGTGSAGIAASAALASKHANHIILQARGRLGGRTYATKLSGITVDLGAIFVHNPQKNNVIDSYVKKLNWSKILANFSQAEILYQSENELSSEDQSKADKIFKNFVNYAAIQVVNSMDMSLQECWKRYNASIASKYPAAALDRAYYEVWLEGNVNGADLNTVSTLAFAKTSGKSTFDYLPSTSYAALIHAIYKTYCKSATILYNQPVTIIDYSGTIAKITTASNQVYYANKVINTIPLGVLKSGAVTFIPVLPNAYQTAIASIGVGIFNKIIVTLNTIFWNDTVNTRIVDMVFPSKKTNNFPQFYIVPSNPKILFFFISGNTSAIFNNQNDSTIIKNLEAVINLYSKKPVKVTNYTITRWEQQPYSKGSYSYYKVGTTTDRFKTLMTSINNKLWFAGEHVHPNQSSNVHGRFRVDCGRERVLCCRRAAREVTDYEFLGIFFVIQGMSSE